MLDFAGSSYGLFAAVWGVLCLLSAAVVIDTMLRDQPSPTAIDAEPAGSASRVEA